MQEPHWRREVERSPHNRAWLAVLAGPLVAFLILEIPALGRAVLNDTASEAVWAAARPFGLGWWLSMPPLLGLFVWLWPHFALRWGGAWHLLACVAAAYAACLILYLIVR